ncbi:MAG TPA: LLM class flavin-dependent oxidoreductase [Acidimicrobiia bacterium]
MPRFSLVTLGASLPEQVSLARRAEAAGFSAMWASEFYDRSATIPLAAMAAATSVIGLGSGVAYGFGRSPLVLAAEARDLDTLSGGRLTLGLGTGTRRMQQDWHGLPGDHPAPRCEELVPLLRRLWRLHEGPVHHEGRFYRTVVIPTAESKPPLRADIPVYLAGVNARMVEAAGAVADGLCGHPLFTPEYVAKVVRPALGRGAARTGRDPDVPIAGTLICAVDADGDDARRAAAAQLAFYLTVKTYDAIADLHGFTDRVEAIRAAWKAGDHPGMVAAVTDEMVDAWALAGTPDEVREQYERRWAGTYDETILYPPNFAGAADPEAILDVFGI